jgi:rhodanese-related sulfurtransferase
MSKNFEIDSIYDQLGLQDGPLIVDLRSVEQLEHAGETIPSAIWVDPTRSEDWSRRLSTHRPVAIYASDETASGRMRALLESRGVACGNLQGGFDAWKQRGLPTVRVRREYRVPGSSRWVTRERPKIDRLACPWLVRRFIDPHAVFFYVPAAAVRTEAIGLGAEPYDIADVTFSHRGPRCSFDAFLDEFGLHDPILDRLGLACTIRFSIGSRTSCARRIQPRWTDPKKRPVCWQSLWVCRRPFLTIFCCWNRRCLSTMRYMRGASSRAMKRIRGRRRRAYPSEY